MAQKVLLAHLLCKSLKSVINAGPRTAGKRAVNTSIGGINDKVQIYDLRTQPPV